AGLAGQALALRRRIAFDIAVLGWRGTVNHIGRDSVLLGTGLSAPGVMLGTQAVATVHLARYESPAAARTLGVLGVLMTGGYPVERAVRTALRPGGIDPVIAPVIVIGTGLGVAMAALGLRTATGVEKPPQAVARPHMITTPVAMSAAWPRRRSRRRR
ncbi:MAG: hypothetical protein QOD45_254, partial [Pseudonocardiales bacterium]|nr:hypothetical protein [Pseudonocardiales bacterium]